MTPFWCRTALIIVPLIAPPLGAQQVLTLDNGDRLSGRLVRLEEAHWLFRTLGTTVRVPAEVVTGFQTADAIGLRLRDGTIVAATVASGPVDSLVLTLADETRRVIVVAEVAAVGRADRLEALRPVEVGLFTPIDRFWSASGSLGFSDKSGNSRARGLTAGIEVARRSPADRLLVAAGVTREESNLDGTGFETTVSRVHGVLRADVFFTSRFFVFGETRHERDRFQDLQLRSIYVGGIGVQLAATEVHDLRLNALSGIRDEHYFGDGDQAAAIIGAGAAYELSVGPAVLAWKVDWAPKAGDVGDYRLRSDATVTARLAGGLGVRVGVLNEHNSHPRPGIERHDMLVTTTLTYQIGQ